MLRIGDVLVGKKMHFEGKLKELFKRRKPTR